MTSEEPVLPFQVRRLAFEYEEAPGTFKERPVIVAHIDDGKSLALVVKVTGHGPRPECPGEVRLLDWSAAGLSKPSVARCSKVASVPLGQVEQAALYGSLSPRDADAVVMGLHEASWA